MSYLPQQPGIGGSQQQRQQQHAHPHPHPSLQQEEALKLHLQRTGQQPNQQANPYLIYELDPYQATNTRDKQDMTVDSTDSYPNLFGDNRSASQPADRSQPSQSHAGEPGNSANRTGQNANTDSTSTANNNNHNNNSSNASIISSERFGINASNINNPALNSFFQLPFELQIQQFPVTNPPLFDFQQPSYQYNNFTSQDPHQDSNAYNDFQMFPNTVGSPGPYQNQQFYPQQQHAQQPQQNHHQHQKQHQPTLRRRISISNGQIGQLVQFTQQQIQLANPTYSPEAVAAATAVALQQNVPAATQAQAQFNQQQQAGKEELETKPPQVVKTQQAPQSSASQPPSLHPQAQAQAPPPHGRRSSQQNPTPPAMQRLSQHPTPDRSQRSQDSDATTPEELSGGLATNSSGIPQHQLLYNNEVIFNPNDGPIPGTAAWKKQKLLERNRIAASKCRQRKKQQQAKLEHDIDKYVRDNRKMAMKVQVLEKKLMKFTKVMEAHFQKCHSGDSSFPLLKELINDTEEEFAKVKLEDDDSDSADIDEDFSSSSGKYHEASFNKSENDESFNFEYSAVAMR